MTTSRDPEKRSSGAKSSAGKASKAPLSRRLRHLVQDTGYAVRKAGRRVTDPIRDTRPKRPRPARPGKPASDEPAGAPRPAGRRAGARGLERPREAGPAKPAEPRAEPKRRERPPAKPRPAARRSKRERAVKPRRERRRRLRARGERRRKGARPASRRRARAAGRVRKPSAAGVATAITGFGERCSKVIRGAVAPLLPPLLGLVALGRRGLAWLARALTPLRAALIVTALAAVLLGVSQFVDYRGVAVGVPDYAAYSDADLVAPAPQVDREPAGSAHAYLLVPVAVIAIALLFAAARGRWQLGRVVSLLGVLAVAVALIVDVPAGLDESAQAVAYSGVEAQLVEGFWVQLFAGVVLVFGGLLVSRYSRRSKRTASRRSRRAAGVGPARARAA
ncbi:MAG TPA: hypothetical protein VFY99_01470 [Solirubrobacterales bacterium]